LKKTTKERKVEKHGEIVRGIKKFSFEIMQFSSALMGVYKGPEKFGQRWRAFWKESIRHARPLNLSVGNVKGQKGKNRVASIACTYGGAGGQKNLKVGELAFPGDN